MLIIGQKELECDSFRFRGAYSDTIARLFSLPVAVENTDPVVIDVVTKGTEFKPYQGSKKVYWNKKFIGFFAVGNVAQEWDGGKYRTRFDLKQCEASDVPEGEIPLYKWRHDLKALAEKLPQTDGAKLEAGRTIDPFANSWKTPTATNSTAQPGDDYDIRSTVLSVALGGTDADNAAIALLNLGGIPSSSRGVPFGVAPLGPDGKVPATFLPSGGGGGGSVVVYPITIAQGGTNANNATQARQNIGAMALADLPPYPTLSSLDAVSNSTFNSAINNINSAIALTLPTSSRGAANGVAPLGADSLVPAANLPAYPTLASLQALAASSRNAANGVAGLDPNSLILPAQVPNNIQFVTAPRTGSTPLNFNTLAGGSACIKWVDGNAGHTFAPNTGTFGALIQHDPLFPVLPDLYRYQIFVSYNNRIVERYQSGGVWSPWVERAYLNRAQTFLNLQEFSNGANFRGGGAPTNLTTGIWATVDANNIPRLWLINSVAAANSRLKSIAVANNGNVQIRHHNDDLSEAGGFELTTSGNLLTAGTVRPGGGTANFSGASFLPGALFYRSDLTMLTYSDGTNWRRMDNNAIV